MNDGDDVRIDFDGIAAAWQDRGGDDVWIEFAPGRRAEPGLFGAMDRAVRAANEALSPDDFGTAVVGTVAGGAVKLKWPPGPEALREWLGVFAGQMLAAGWSGSLHAAPGVRPPAWLTRMLEPRLTVYVSYDVAPPDGLGPDLCETAAQWAQRNGGPDAYLLSSALTLPDRTGELGRHLHLALSGRASTAATCVSAQPGPLSRVSLAADGRASYQVYDPRFAPLALMDRAREALLAAAGQTRVAVVALTKRESSTWATLAKTLGQTTPAPSWATARNNPLWSRYVPDAFGLQLLTEEHLNRTADLTGWTVAEAAPGRYLVEAPDPAEWFGPAGPSAQVVAAARVAFGDAVIPADLPQQ